jgi:hypothetical protein
MFQKINQFLKNPILKLKNFFETKKNLLYLVAISIISGILVQFTAMVNNNQIDKVKTNAKSEPINPLELTPVLTSYDSSIIDLRIGTFQYSSEITPLTFAVGDKKTMILSTDHSWRCLMDKSIIDVFLAGGSQLIAPLEDCSIVAKPESLINITDNGIFEFNLDINNYGSRHWARNYWGILDAAVIRDSDNNLQFLSVHHGENMNSKYSDADKKDYFIQGTFRNDVNVGDCASGFNDGVYEQCWESFGSFTSVSASPFNSLSLINKALNKNIDINQISAFELGPVVWPEKGYYNDTGNFSSGPYHPTLFADKDTGYVYLFYTQDWGKQDPFKDVFKCIGVSRARLDDVKADKWQVMKNGQFNTPALPVNFQKDNILQFLDEGASNGDCLNLPNNDGVNDASIWFSVVKIANSPYYAALEEHSPNNDTYQLNFRLSTDLINWSPPQTLSTADQNWGASKYSYPTFYNKYGASSDVIEASEFYILGKRATNSSGYELSVMRACIDIPGINSCPPKLNAEELLVRQYYREFLGWNLKIDDTQFQDSINWHVQKMTREGCFSDIAIFLQSEEYNKRDKTLNNKEYIRMLYRGGLSREPDWQYANYWLDKLNRDNISRFEVAKLMLGSRSSWEAKEVCDQKRVLGAP